MTPPESLGICVPCGCTFNMRGTPLAQCRLHGQSRQIQATLRCLLREYDRTGKFPIYPGSTLEQLRRFAS